MKFNIKKYMGLWYEIAKKPFGFQSGCKNAKAMYSLKKDHVRVINTCVDNVFGTKRVTRGKAYQTDNPFILKVKFSRLAPASDYIIVYVSNDYMYAIVGTRTKRYMWVLSRKAKISKAKFNYLLVVAKKKGYDVSNVQISRPPEVNNVDFHHQ